VNVGTDPRNILRESVEDVGTGPMFKSLLLINDSIRIHGKTRYGWKKVRFLTYVDGRYGMLCYL